MSDQPKPTGDCTCDNAFGLHWGKCPINMNTKPIGEWTVESVIALLAGIRPSLHHKVIADAHNAALDAAKSGGWLSEEALDEYAKVEQEVLQLRDQLAAEREKLREERAKFHGDDYADMDAARNRILDLEKQLAAERERLSDMKTCAEVNGQIADHLRTQLAAAQAAMKSAEALLHDYVVPADVRKFLLSGDTAALDAAIAAARIIKCEGGGNDFGKAMR